MTAHSGTAWTAEHLVTLRELIDEGYSYDEIAARLGRTRDAVEIKCKRALGIRLLTTQARLTAQQVADLLGIGYNSKTVILWIQRGWLQARHGSRAAWRIAWNDLIAFVARRDYWMAYDAHRIRDTALRVYVLRLQAEAGGRWMTTAEVATQLCVSRGVVEMWIRCGALPAVRSPSHKFWIWSADLDGWVLPSERSRAGIPRSARRRIVGNDRLEPR